MKIPFPVRLCQDNQRANNALLSEVEATPAMVKAAGIGFQSLNRTRRALAGFDEWQFQTHYPYVAPDSLYDRDGMPRRSRMTSDRYGAI